MSHIYEALQRAQADRGKSTDSSDTSDHLLALFNEENATGSPSVALEQGFESSRRGLRRAFFLLAMVVLSFIGVAYALRTRTGTLPKKGAGVIFDGTCEPARE